MATFVTQSVENAPQTSNQAKTFLEGSHHSRLCPSSSWKNLLQAQPSASYLRFPGERVRDTPYGKVDISTLP
jgi:hypothetical protein